MKKIYLFLFVPLLLSFQCEDDLDPLYGTEFYIQNNASIDLIWLNTDGDEITIESQSEQFIAISTDRDFIILPSKTNAFDVIILYKKEESGALSMLYEQNPVIDELWVFNSMGDFEGTYTLVITDDAFTP